MKKLSLPKEKINILLLEGVHKNAVQYFKSNGYTNIEYSDKALDKHILIEKIKNVHLLGIRSRTQLTTDVLEHASKLVAVGCFSIGTNQVDLQTAKMMGIPVFNAPFSNTRSVAELVIAETIMLMRGIPEKNMAAHAGRWLKSANNSYEVRGKNLGIIGYGHIGSQVSVLAESLGMNVFYYDIETKLSIGNATACDSLDELLSKAHVVTLHVPSTEQTHEMIGSKQLQTMPEGSFLINASRGNVVDYPALAKSLKDKHLLGAAIDVFAKEPASNQHEFISDLRGLHNVLLTPHIGGSTIEAQANIALEVSEKLVKYSDNGSTVGATNFMEIHLPPNQTRQRFMHIHKNIPGMLRKINNVFTSKDINIAAEYLQTDSDIGYVVIDIDKEMDENILEELKNIENTIRARMLY